jgi:hypothetical protein
VRVDPGNDPGRDEYGLPPVEIEIPDDARDLDRDVQAYHRELRARRRHTRVRRLTAPLTRHGMVMPLVAACLAVTLLTGTLLTVLAGRQVPLLPSRGALGTTRPSSPGPSSTGPASTGPASTGPASTGPANAARQLPSLPNAQVILGSKQVGLRSLVPAVLAWVPTTCACAAVLRQLARQAAAARVRIYFVGTAAAVAELLALASQAGPGYRQKVIQDQTDALVIAYHPVGLTAILAQGSDSVEVVRNVQAGVRQFGDRLRVFAGTVRVPATASSAPVRQPVP